MNEKACVLRMNPLYKAYCRVFQFGFRVAMPILPYREPGRLGAIDDLGPLMQKLQVKSALLVTDSFLKSSGATAPVEAALEKSGVRCVVYDNTRPNPTVNNVEEAFAMCKEGQCQCLIAFGGGSSMDCAKGVGARVAYPSKTATR